MCNEVTNYEDACKLSRSDLELEIMLTVKNLLFSKTLDDHRYAHNRFNAFVFRLAELKGLYYEKK